MAHIMAPLRHVPHSLLEGVKGMDFNENMLHDSATPVQHWVWTLSIFLSPVLLAQKLPAGCSAGCGHPRALAVCQGGLGML